MLGVHPRRLYMATVGDLGEHVQLLLSPLSTSPNKEGEDDHDDDDDRKRQ